MNQLSTSLDWVTNRTWESISWVNSIDFTVHQPRSQGVIVFFFFFFFGRTFRGTLRTIKRFYRHCWSSKVAVAIDPTWLMVFYIWLRGMVRSGGFIRVNFVWDVDVMSVSVASRFLLYFLLYFLLLSFSIICFCVVRSWRWNPCASWAVMSIRLLRKRTSKAGLAWCNLRRWDFPFRLQKCWVSAIQSNLCKQDISGQNCNSNVPGIVNAARLAHCQHPCSKTASKQCCTDYLIFSSHQLSIVPNFKTHKGRECTPAMWIVNYEGVFGLLWSFYFSTSALCFLRNWFLWVVFHQLCAARTVVQDQRYQRHWKKPSGSQEYDRTIATGQTSEMI